jgi:hypothetical protein
MAIRVEHGAEPIPGYKLLERLGGGGFGEVWKAEAPGGLLKAIKIVHGDVRSGEAQDADRAEQELRALRRVQAVRHPYLLSLERYDVVEGRLLIVMELADCNLWDRFRECRTEGHPGIPRDELLRYMAESAEALDLMNNQHGLQHLDIKPQNLFLVHGHVKVADFGLVKDLEGVRSTVTGGVTPVYAAPETFDGVVTRFCDQYSLAIVYQELLCGQRPFNGTSVQQLIMQHLSASPNLSPLPASDRSVLARALSKKPEDRFPSCLALVRALVGAGEAVGRAPNGAPLVAAESGGSTKVHGRPRPIPDPAMDTPATHFRVQREETPSEPFRPAPPERVGEGCLVPAVVVGIGQVGLGVLQRFRQHQLDRFGSARHLPHLRLVYIDTDPEAADAATLPAAAAPLAGDEVVLAKLNRASHYLKPRRGGQSLLDGWFDPQLLYRIPRTPMTAGVRALGRLAFADHARAITHKLETELDACTLAEALDEADRHTGLGLRTSRPRVYVVAGLGGATGGGMFLDVAYAARYRLRQMGYAEPEVVGLLLLPPVERQAGKASAVGNAYAALTELHHYCTPGTVFTANFDENGGPISDAGPPFCRFGLVPLAAGAEPGSRADGLGRAAEYLNRDLLSPLGRAADDRRAAAPPGGEPGAVGGLSFGLSQFAWPRRQLLDLTARQLALSLLDRWTAPGGAAVRPAVRTWVADQWHQQQLGPEHLVRRLQEAAEQALGKAPEAVFAAEADPLVPRSRWRRDVDTTALRAAVARLEGLVGPASGAEGPRATGVLAEAVAKAAPVLAREWGMKLTQLAVCLIEQPEFRLAGAEEAIARLRDGLEQVIGHYGPIEAELSDRSDEAHTHLLTALFPDRPRKRPSATEVLDGVRLFPKFRFQSLVARQVVSVCVGLRQQLADELSEIGFCRQRLAELRRALEEAEPSCPADPEQQLLPAGCRSLEEAAERLLEQVGPQELRELDRRVQALVEQNYSALVQVCMSSSGDLLAKLQTLLLQQAREFMSPRLGGADVVEMFLAKYPRPEQAAEAVHWAYEEARPDLAGGFGVSREAEFCVLSVPPGPKAERFQQLLSQSLGEANLGVAAAQEDIAFYREAPHVALSDLPNLGPAAEEAYRQMAAMFHTNPHTRVDVAEWEGPVPS